MNRILPPPIIDRCLQFGLLSHIFILSKSLARAKVRANQNGLILPLFAVAGRVSARRLSAKRGTVLLAAIVMVFGFVGPDISAGDEPASASHDFSGWRGGIGITFGIPSRDIPDVSELGYDIVWSSEEP